MLQPLPPQSGSHIRARFSNRFPFSLIGCSALFPAAIRQIFSQTVWRRARHREIRTQGNHILTEKIDTAKLSWGRNYLFLGSFFSYFMARTGFSPRMGKANGRVRTPVPKCNEIRKNVTDIALDTVGVSWCYCPLSPSGGCVHIEKRYPLEKRYPHRIQSVCGLSPVC